MVTGKLSSVIHCEVMLRRTSKEADDLTRSEMQAGIQCRSQLEQSIHPNIWLSCLPRVVLKVGFREEHIFSKAGE